MPSAWLISLKRSMNCKTDSSDAKQPENNDTSNSFLCSSRCSKSLCNLRDVIHGSKRHTNKAPIGSPGSIRSSEILNPITHRAVFADSRCVLEIKTRCSGNDSGKKGSTFVGTLRPGTPGPGDRFVEPVLGSKGPSILGSGCGVDSKPRRSLDLESRGYVCQKCGEKFKKLEAIEEHHISMHAVTELLEEDSSKKIVELICRTGFSESENNFFQIERILKVHNTQRSLAQFEDYREMVKLKAHKLSKKHPRCLADGNELLRFHGTTIACSLGTENTSSLCTLEKCGVCQILRYGFLSKKEPNGCWGVFTCSTSKRATERTSTRLDEANRCVKKALLVCRVIAGRVLKPLEKLKEKEGQLSFDSMAGEADCHSSIDELYSLNPRALLPCFVVVIRTN